MPLLILQLLFLSSGGGIWEEITDGFAWRKFNFQTALPTWALHRRSLRAPFCFSCAGGSVLQELLRTGWWGIIRQTNSLLMSQARRRFQAWMNYFSSLLGTLIMSHCLCIQELARLSASNPFFNFIFVHSFFHSDRILKKKGIHNSHCCLVINTEVSERCLARCVWIPQSICCAVLRITQQCCVLHMTTFPLPQEWRDADSLRVSGAHGCAHEELTEPQTECLLLSGRFLVFREFSLDSPLVNSTVPWPSFIRHCQMEVFQERCSDCLGVGTPMSSLTSCTG